MEQNKPDPNAAKQPAGDDQHAEAQPTQQTGEAKPTQETGKTQPTQETGEAQTAADPAAGGGGNGSGGQWGEFGRRRIARRSYNKVLGGVASGIADSFGVDPWLVRVLFIVGTVLGGSGFFAYIAAYFLIPSDKEVPGGLALRDIASVRGNNRPWGWLAVGLALLLLIDGLFEDGTHLVLPLALIAFGIFLLRDRPDRDHHSRGPVNASSHGDGERVVTPAYGSSASPAHTGQRPIKTAKPPSVLGGITVGLAVLAAGLGVAVTQANWIDLSVGQVFALPLVVLGGGLMVGAWRGRARWLAILAVILIPIAGLAGVADDASFDGAGDGGERRYAPTSLEELQTVYSNGAGRLELDLSMLPSFDGTRDVEVGLGAGEVIILLPRTAATVISAHAGFGEVKVLNEVEGGLNADVDKSTAGLAGTLNINAHVGFGHVYITDDINDREVKQ